jgi:hypothetical protein
MLILETPEPDMTPTPGPAPFQGLPPEEIARVCHEVNRTYCECMGDNSQPEWRSAGPDIKASAISGVDFHMRNPFAGPEASHENWMADKIAAGWKYGEEKDPEAKTHPCIVPFDELPKEQQAKDWLFRGVVHALAGGGL